MVLLQSGLIYYTITVNWNAWLFVRYRDKSIFRPVKCERDPLILLIETTLTSMN